MDFIIAPGVNLSRYNPLYSLAIRLFGLIGLLGVCTAPVKGRYVDRLHHLTGVLIVVFVQAFIETWSVGTINIAAVIVGIFFLYVGQQIQQVSNQMGAYRINDLACPGPNACFLIYSSFVPLL